MVLIVKSNVFFLRKYTVFFLWSRICVYVIRFWASERHFWASRSCFRVSGSRFLASGSRFLVHGCRYFASGSRFWVSGSRISDSLWADVGRLGAKLGPLRVNFSLEGRIMLLSLNIGLMKLIVGLWESIFGVCGENSIHFGKRCKKYVIRKVKAYLYYNSIRFFCLFSLK